MRCFFILLALLSTPAIADTTAVYSAQNGLMTMTVEIASTGEMRVTMGGTMLDELKKKAPADFDLTQAGGIARDGENYLIQPGPDGSAVVIRMADAAVVMKEFLDSHRDQFPTPPDAVLDDLKLIERGTLTVNGRTGKAFYFDGAGKIPVAVISSDADLAELGAAMRRQFATSAQMMGSVGFPIQGNMMDAVLKEGAPLAFSGMELQSVTHDPISPTRFVLPAEPATLDRVRILMAPKKIVREAGARQP